MSSGTPPGDLALDGEGFEALARDWMTIWQSEWAALAVDREVRESIQALLALWSPVSGRIGPPGGGGPAAAPWPPAAAAASDAGDAEVGRLTERVAELERRLADLERD